MRLLNQLSSNSKIIEVRTSFVRLLCASVAWILGCAVVACTPFDVVTTLGPDAAYTASEDRDVGDVWDDNMLKLSLNKALLDDSAGLFKDIGTVVYEGKVLLIGAVESPDARRRAVRIVRRQDGVRSVVDRIQVTDEGGVFAYFHDAAIEKRIQTEILFDKDVDSSNLRVRSVNRRVYLFGEARNRSEMTETIRIAKDVEEVHLVENLMWLRGDTGRKSAAAR